MITLGLERLIADPPGWLANKRLGLLCNQASTDSRFHHTRDLIHQAFPGKLACLLSPQHGFFSEKQDNMVESEHAVDPITGLPIFSLYGKERKPDSDMLDHLDVLLIDLIDVGTRVYTFIYTVAYCMEAAAEQGKKVVVLDRPNPVGGLAVEGNLLKPDWQSFVGLYPIPMRHGLTIGEFARFINERFDIGCDLEVIPMRGWQRHMLYEQTGLPWVFPSPNMPTSQTAMVYPGQVIWEGTNVSEGRGTTLPFELVGAPFFEPRAIMDFIADLPLPGCVLRPLTFEPTSGKWAGEACHGFQLHVQDPRTFLPYRTSLALLQATIRLYPEQFSFKEPPYEYEFELLPMDLILGDGNLRQAMAAGEDLLELEKGWLPELAEYDRLRREYFLYEG